MPTPEVAQEPSGTALVNPHDNVAVALDLQQALAMRLAERRSGQEKCWRRYGTTWVGLRTEAAALVTNQRAAARILLGAPPYAGSLCLNRFNEDDASPRSFPSFPKFANNARERLLALVFASLIYSPRHGRRLTRCGY
jgi:hypothetical protein